MKYIQAIGWFILSLLASSSNDALTKYLAYTLDPWQISFFRFGFASLTLLPFMLYQGKKAFATHRWSLHVGRGVLLFIAISLWGQGIKSAPMTTATLMSFSVPLFVLLLAPICLQEPIAFPMWVATLGGFVGIFFVLQPRVNTFNQASLFFLVAAILFALLDVLNKKYVTQESTWSMLFYSNVVAWALITYPTVQVWRTPTLLEITGLLALGIGGNLILYFLLCAFSLTSASSLVPFRYLELFISMILSYAFFNELPTSYSYLGAAIIIPCTFFIGYHQTRRIGKFFK